MVDKSCPKCKGFLYEDFGLTYPQKKYYAEIYKCLNCGRHFDKEDIDRVSDKNTE